MRMGRVAGFIRRPMRRARGGVCVSHAGAGGATALRVVGRAWVACLCGFKRRLAAVPMLLHRPCPARLEILSGFQERLAGIGFLRENRVLPLFRLREYVAQHVFSMSGTLAMLGMPKPVRVHTIPLIRCAFVRMS